MTLTQEPQGLQWSLPPELQVAPDQLKVRLDFYETTVVAHFCGDGVISTRVVSARDVALALLGETSLISGLLPRDTLCWGPGQVALWQDPRIWPVALMPEPLKPARRLQLPMPGLIFNCRPSQAPRVYAAKRRPQNMKALIYHAPFFNTYSDGTTCAGSNKYPAKIEEIPKSFMVSFFTAVTDRASRSKKYGNDLMKLWTELDGKKRYPLDDLVPFGTLRDVFTNRKVMGTDQGLDLVNDLPPAEEWEIPDTDE
jgi:PRTRC genetic system protein B